MDKLGQQWVTPGEVLVCTLLIAVACLGLGFFAGELYHAHYYSNLPANVTVEGNCITVHAPMPRNGGGRGGDATACAGASGD
jgi:hypothetical protein